MWQALRVGMSVDEISKWLSTNFPAETTSIAPAVDEFVARLLDEGMIAAAPGPASSPPPPLVSFAAYAPPLVERFDDLTDLLLLDPVHDVTEAGWPHLPEQS